VLIWIGGISVLLFLLFLVPAVMFTPS